jgi:hypothetical protein
MKYGEAEIIIHPVPNFTLRHAVEWGNGSVVHLGISRR